MPLTLTITSYQRLAPGQNTSKTFDRCNASIGRGPENDWVLPDPEMVLSRKHCMIEYRDSQYYLIDSSVNGVFVNQSQERLGRGNAVLLKDGDELILGDYEIIVGLSEPGNLAAGPLPSSGPKDFLNENSDIFATAKPPPTPGPGVPGPGASLGLDSLIMAPVAARNNLPPPAELTSGEASGPFSLGLDSLGLGPGPAGNRPAPPSTASAPANSPDPLGLNQPANPLWKQHSGFDHLPSDQEFFRPPSAVPDNANGAADLIPPDWDKSLIMAKPAPAGQTPSARPEPKRASAPAPANEPPIGMKTEQIAQLDLSDILGTDILKKEPRKSEPPPAVQAAKPAPPPAQPDAASSPQPASASGPFDLNAMQAFLQGAGLEKLRLPDQDAPRLMHNIGAIFRQTVQGMMELLRARATIKTEIRIDRTMVGPIENNPLKILPSADEAMYAMLTKREHTWMPATQAIRESFNDIRAHELAMMAGMEAALSHLLKTFDPTQLEQQLGQSSALGAILPGGRKAKYWDAFTALYNKIAEGARDDFRDLFSKEFARAYETQQRKLKNQ